MTSQVTRCNSVKFQDLLEAFWSKLMITKINSQPTWNICRQMTYTQLIGYFNKILYLVSNCFFNFCFYLGYSYKFYVLISWGPYDALSTFIVTHNMFYNIQRFSCVFSICHNHVNCVIFFLVCNMTTFENIGNLTCTLSLQLMSKVFHFCVYFCLYKSWVKLNLCSNVFLMATLLNKI